MPREEKSLLQVLARSGSQFLDQYLQLNLAQEKQTQLDTAAQQKADVAQERWLMNFKAAERRHKESIQNVRDVEKRRVDRASRKAAVDVEKEQIKARTTERKERGKAEKELSDKLFDLDVERDKPKSLDERFDLFLQGGYEPTGREGPVFEKKLRDMQTGTKKYDKAPNIVKESVDLSREIASSRTQISKANEAAIGGEPLADPFLGIDNPVQAYNLAFRAQVQGDPRFGATQPERDVAADSIQQVLDPSFVPETAEEINPADFLPAGDFDSDPTRLLKSSGEFIGGAPAAAPAPGATIPPSASATLEVQRFTPDQRIEATNLLLKWKQAPDDLTEEEYQRLIQIIYGQE